ncbi:MAG: hypothetical protein KBT09_05895 [Bacteroidales bacterium]|nr:hypothetical protein [Candidatus Sodaliphilus fimicaballi]
MNGFKAYKLSLAMDCVCILIAVVILYCANNALLPTWALVVGALVAFGFLIFAIMLLMVARRSFKQGEKQEVSRIEDAITSEENKPEE